MSGEVVVHHGDSREVLRTLADCSVDSVVCDPPYALVSIGKRFGADDGAAAKVGKSGAYQRASSGFMGQKWDTGETAFEPAFWREVLRVLKPGGHVVAFGGTRSYHRLACAIEDSGFEIRDMLVELLAIDVLCGAFLDGLTDAQRALFVRILDESSFGGMLAWIYGSGFPKSHDVSKGIGRAAASAASAAWEGWGTALKPALEPICLARKALDGTVAANVLRWGTGALNIDGCRVEASGRPLRCAAELTSGDGGAEIYGDFALVGSRAMGTTDRGRWPANVIHDGSGEVIAAFPDRESGGDVICRRSAKTKGIYGQFLGGDDRSSGYPDTGSAARFFYSAKADSTDRLGSKHPTVKPVDLMRWLCRLVTPSGGLVLDPFAGSGSTGVAALAEGFDAVLIEREAGYVADIRRRIAWARGEGGLTGQEKARSRAAADDHGPLFATGDAA